MQCCRLSTPPRWVVDQLVFQIKWQSPKSSALSRHTLARRSRWREIPWRVRPWGCQSNRQGRYPWDPRPTCSWEREHCLWWEDHTQRAERRERGGAEVEVESGERVRNCEFFLVFESRVIFCPVIFFVELATFAQKSGNCNNFYDGTHKKKTHMRSRIMPMVKIVPARK